MHLNVIQLAESFGVDEAVVDGWIRKDALPFIQDRGRLLFDRVQVVHWAAQRGLAAKAGFLAPTQPASRASLKLDGLLRIGGIWRDIEPSRVIDVLEQIVARLPGATPEVGRILKQRLHAPGGVAWAPVGGGIALPHLRLPVTLGRDAGLLALIFLNEALPLAEAVPDSEPVRRLVFFIAPSSRVHLELLATLGSALSRGALRQLVLDAAGEADIFAAISSDGLYS